MGKWDRGASEWRQQDIRVRAGREVELGICAGVKLENTVGEEAQRVGRE